MKKTIIIAFMAIVSACALVSCNKTVDLAGTQWKAVLTETQSEGGMSAEITVTSVMNFNDATNGAINVDIVTSMNGIVIPDYCSNYTNNFTYTFNGDCAGMLYAIDADSDDEPMPFSYNRDTKQITMSSTDDETGETITLVFNKVK